jgi:hypothetical protein
MFMALEQTIHQSLYDVVFRVRNRLEMTTTPITGEAVADESTTASLWWKCIHRRPSMNFWQADHGRRFSQPSDA